MQIKPKSVSSDYEACALYSDKQVGPHRIRRLIVGLYLCIKLYITCLFI